jgi:cell division protein FtsB
MKLSKIIFIIYCCLIANSTVIFFLGDEGCSEYTSLLKQKNRLEENIDNLKMINTQLNEKLDKIKTSREKIGILARDLGLYNHDEKVVIIKGYNQKTNFYEIGTHVNALSVKTEKNSATRLIFLCLCICSIIVYIILARLRYGNQKQ